MIGKVWTWISAKEPASTAGAMIAILNGVALFTPWNPSADDLAKLNGLIVIVLTWAVRRQVTAPANLVPPAEAD